MNPGSYGLRVKCSPGIFTIEATVPKGARAGWRGRYERWYRYTKMEEAGEELVASRGRGSGSAASNETRCIVDSESKREGARRSDRCPVDQNVMYANEVWQAYRIPGPPASSSRFILLPFPFPCPPVLGPTSSLPGRSIRFRKNVLYKQKQIKTLILLYVNRQGGETERSQAHYEAACLLSLQARTRAFFLASLFSPLLFCSLPFSTDFSNRLCLAASRQPIHLVDTYTTFFLLGIYM